MKKRGLLVSIAITLLCVTLIVGATFALFTDTANIKTHLKAGKLDVSLTRESLTYTYLDDQGKLVQDTVTGSTDFTDPSSQNVFGLEEWKSLKMVPTSFFSVDMKIENLGDVAFDYSVGITMEDDDADPEFIKQVSVTIIKGNTEITKTLAELASGLTINVGTMLKNAQPDTFTVKVTFDNKTDGSNNLVMEKMAEFDLFVTAVQATA